MKRFAALMLAACMALALCGCQRTVIEAYDAASNMDFEEAWIRHAPGEVVFTVDGEEVTWRELFYQIKYFAEAMSEEEGVELASWDQVSTLHTTADGGPATYGYLVLQSAVATLRQYHVVHKNLTDAGVTLGAEGLEAVKTMRRDAIEDNFGGDEQKFLAYLQSMFCTDELWTWFCEVDALYAYDGFERLFGQFGRAMPDGDVLVYAEGSPRGVWTEYVQVERIYLYRDGEGSEKAAEREIDAALRDASGAGLEGVFREMYEKYNENPAIDPYIGGRCAYEGDLEDEVYEKALEMTDYEYALVSTEDADVYVLRVPIQPDAGVYYDEKTETMYTLRYYAAWQAYSDLINGDDGWIASAEVSWADGFGDFTLQKAFSPSQLS